jgi:threonine dehydrogenase-like Zn-dependent dehydrogenase
MDMKSLAVDAKGNLFIQELTMPKFNDFQALVKMESCGICRGTDTKLIHGQFKDFHTYPAILGHEGVGRVVEKGKHVQSFELGDLVLLPFLESETDGFHSGWGAFSEFAVVGDAKAMIAHGKGPGDSSFSEAYYAQQKVPEDISAVQAAMIITFREVLSACKRFGFRENASLVVYGAGPVGLAFIKFAKLLGMNTVIVSVNRDEKLQEALDAGADYVFNSKKVNLVEQVRKLYVDGVDFIVDAVGDNAIINQSMELVKYNGSICCYGISAQLQMNLDWSKAPYNWTLQFVQWPSKLEESLCHEQIIEWIQTGALNPDDFISHVMTFDRILDAFQLVNSGTVRKMVIQF